MMTNKESLESFINFCNNMKIAEEKTLLRLEAENANHRIANILKNVHTAKTDEEKILIFKELDKEIDNSISKISSLNESVFDKNDKIIKKTISTSLALIGIISTICSKWYIKPLTVGVFGTASLVTGISSSISDQYHNKKDIIKKLKDNKSIVNQAIKYLESNNKATESFKQWVSAKKENTKLLNTDRTGLLDSMNELNYYSKNYIIKKNSNIVIPFKKIVNSIYSLVKSEYKDTQVNYYVNNKRIRAVILIEYTDSNCDIINKKIKEIFYKKCRNMKIELDINDEDDTIYIELEKSFK